jgi:hypothetical protein
MGGQPTGSSTFVALVTGGDDVEGQTVTVEVAPGGEGVATVSPPSQLTDATGTTPAFTVEFVGAGSTSIEAECEGQKAEVQVSVSAIAPVTLTLSTDPSPLNLDETTLPGGTLTATVAGGTSVEGQTVSVSAGDPGIAIVSPASLPTDSGGAAGPFTVTAVSAGSTTLTATCEQQTASVPVAVSGTAPVTLTVTPTQLSLDEDNVPSSTFTAKVTGGASVQGQTVTVSSSSPGVAVVAPTSQKTGSNGVTPNFTVTYLGGGTAQITASCESQKAYLQVTCTDD